MKIIEGNFALMAVHSSLVLVVAPGGLQKKINDSLLLGAAILHVRHKGEVHVPKIALGVLRGEPPREVRVLVEPMCDARLPIKGNAANYALVAVS